MEQGEYKEQKNQYKWRKRFKWAIGTIFGLLLSWLMIGLWIGWWGYKKYEKYLHSDQYEEIDLKQDQEQPVA